MFSDDPAALSRRAGALHDEAAFLAAFGEPPGARAGEGEVCCRECGRPTASVAAHAGAAHGMSADEYEKRHPHAPAGSERGLLAPAGPRGWAVSGSRAEESGAGGG